MRVVLAAAKERRRGQGMGCTCSPAYVPEGEKVRERDEECRWMTRIRKDNWLRLGFPFFCSSSTLSECFRGHTIRHSRVQRQAARVSKSTGEFETHAVAACRAYWFLILKKRLGGENMKCYTTKGEYDRKADIFPAEIPIIQAGAFRMEICHATCISVMPVHMLAGLDLGD